MKITQCSFFVKFTEWWNMIWKLTPHVLCTCLPDFQTHRVQNVVMSLCPAPEGRRLHGAGQDCTGRGLHAAGSAVHPLLSWHCSHSGLFLHNACPESGHTMGNFMYLCNKMLHVPFQGDFPHLNVIPKENGNAGKRK